MPGTRSSPGTPRASQLVRDPERVTVPEAPITYSPTRSRSKPFLPARRAPEGVNEPVSTVHDAHVEPLPYSGRPSAETQKPDAFMPESSPAHVSESVSPNLPNEHEKPNLAPNLVDSQKPQKPTQNITTLFPNKYRFVGRGVGRDRAFFETIELLTFVQKKGTWPDGTTDKMQRYYKKYYPEYFSAAKRFDAKRSANKQRADTLRAANRPRRRKVKPVLHTA